MNRMIALAGALALAVIHHDVSAAGQTGRVDLEAADCASINQMFGDFEVARTTQRASVPATAGALDVRPDFNGGVRIERGGGGVYGITACVAAGARTRREAEAAVAGVRLDVQGAIVRVRGADPTRAQSLSVQLIVAAPDGASIQAETSNGPIGVRDFAGTLDLRAANGPISLHGVDGDVKAHASNGPISVTASRGEFDVQTANGPIDVRLDGQRWDGHLTARASNGPLTLSVPPDFQSGVEVRSGNHSPWSCRAAACSASGGRDWDDSSRLLRIGTDPVVVHLSTVNGPVTVRDR